MWDIKDIDSSDSETHDTLGLQRQTSQGSQRKEFDSLKVRKKYQQIVRQKNWMKTPTRIRKAKKIAIRVANSHTKFIADKLCKRLRDLQIYRNTKRQSLQAQSVRAVIQKYHTKRLDQLLNGNDMKRMPVRSDGNCFFTAFAKSAALDTTIIKLRKDVCNYCCSRHNY